MEINPKINKSVVNKLKEWKHSPLQFIKDCIPAFMEKITEQQIEFFSNLPKNKRISIRSGHGCHAKGTIVHMFPFGFKAVEDIKVGEYLMGNDNTPRKVLKLIRGREEMARIKYHDGTYYDVNMSHILALVCTGNKCEFKTGDKLEMTVREYLQMINKRPSLKGRFACYKVSIEYPTIPVIIPPYILGMWLGDGSHNRIELTNIDKELICIWELFGEANGLRMTTDPNGKLHRLVGDKDNLVHKAFEHYNLFGNKHIPKEYLFNSKEIRLKVLAGLIDTDGYANTKNTLQYQIIQKRKSLAEDILFLAQSCGIHATLKEKIKSWTWNKEKKYGVYYEVVLSRNTQQIPVQLKRKKSPISRTIQRPNLHFGFTVEKLKEDNYYGFTLDGNKLYVLGDFTVTHNCGKDASVAIAILWFASTRAYAKIACTAPTNRQLKDILLAEISKWLRQSTLEGEFIVRKDIIHHKDAPKEWWIRFISPSVKATKEEQAETLAGLHADHLLIVVDEASGVVDPIYTPLEGALTQEDNKVILIGNMTKNNGYFYNTHFHSAVSSMWYKIHWDSRKSPLVSTETIAYFAMKYGVDSNVFRVRVMGEPPLQDEETLIPLYAAQQCIGNEVMIAEDEPLYLGVDVARYGSDSSIILPRKGLLIQPWEVFNKLNTIDLGGFISQTYQDIEAKGCAVDVIGVGAGVFDWLQKHNMKNLYGVNVANSSSDITKYDRLRDELWVRVKEKCLLGLYSFPDIKLPQDTESLGEQLANELAIMRYRFNSHGGIKVESKKELKVRGIASPNIADALCLTEYFSNKTTRVFAKAADAEEKAKYANTFTSNTGWMQ